MKSVVAVLSLLLAAGSTLLTTGCSSSIRAPEPPTGPHFKVMTFNVNYGGPGADEALDAILAEDADLVCLQETTRAWERFLRPQLQKKYPFVRFHHSGGAGGLALFSKRAVSEPILLESAVGWFPSWIFLADTPVGPVQVGNLHLHPGVNEQGSFTPSAYLSTAPAARLEETKAVHRKLDLSLPTLLVGDLNEGDSGRSVAWLGKRGFKDALPQFDSSTETWHWRTSTGIRVSHRLDHLMHSEHLKCLDAGVRKKGQSDHYPVVAVFEKR